MVAGRSESNPTGDIKGRASEFPLPRHAQHHSKPCLTVHEACNKRRIHACIPIVHSSTLVFHSIDNVSGSPSSSGLKPCAIPCRQPADLLLISQATKPGRHASRAK
jgi:hypothetical protein